MRALLMLLLLASIGCPSNSPVSECQADQGLVRCGAACVALVSDPMNCGACGHACPATDKCIASACYSKDCASGACLPQQVCPAGACVDETCVGVLCPSNQACVRGTCLERDCSAQTCGPAEVCSNGMCAVAACLGVICPAGSVCVAGACVSNTCENGFKDGTESGADCGGFCPKCAVGAPCSVAADCLTGSCVAGLCSASSCADGVRNGDEPQVDCGGSCPLCAASSPCLGPSTCASGVCAMGRCTPPACTDGVRNGLETDVDCGQACPTPCVDGKSCLTPGDCSSSLCAQGRCVPTTCNDAMRNGDETDLNCGGSCGGCSTGQMCMMAPDCASRVCTMMRCVAPACADGVTNGTETDRDCGGPCPTKCGTALRCLLDTDCLSQRCVGNRCAAPSCSDGVKNGSESDVDCGGACPGCGTGKACTGPTDCRSADCVALRCVARQIFAPAVVLPLSGQAFDLASGQLDGDGWLDLAAITNTTSEVLTFFGSDAGFAAGPILGLQGNVNFAYETPGNLAIGDIDGDGRPDIVSARKAWSGGAFGEWLHCYIESLLNRGSRSFSAPVASYSYFVSGTTRGCGGRMELGHLDSDLKADLVTGDWFQRGYTHFESYGAYVLKASDAGYFLPATQLGGAGSSPIITDFNLDGVNDIVARKQSVGSLTVFFNDGGFSGTQSDGGSRFGAAALPPDISVSTGNGVGDPIAALLDPGTTVDLAWTEQTGVVVQLGGAGGTLSSSRRTYTIASCDGVVAGDFDRDGVVDLAATCAGLWVLRGLGDGTFDTPEQYFASLGLLTRPRMGDFNRDGKPDVACLGQWQNRQRNEVLVFLDVVP